ncbi:epsin-2-like [Paramacrobiotus metropolitanus]|uniref:epsin-2-like n=1 Tax=Paramacrobiotus metropolitanus TaxID=2943436 RepID=UPI002446039D|nr:epsin-2-like [Paramacrobiotus metropolitanus]
MSSRRHGDPHSTPVRTLIRVAGFLVKWCVLYTVSRILCWNYILPGFLVLLTEMHSLHRACRRAIYKLDTTITDPIQVQIRECTSTDPWGPTAAQMAEIAEAAATRSPLILSEIWFRLDEDNWKHVYKALVLLDYLIKHGPESVAKQCWMNVDRLRELRSYPFVEADGNPARRIREKAGQVLGLMADAGRLTVEREKARRIRERVQYKDREFHEFFHGIPPDLSNPQIKGTVCEAATGDACCSVLQPRSEEEEALHLQLALTASQKDAELRHTEQHLPGSPVPLSPDLIDLSAHQAHGDLCTPSGDDSDGGASKRRLIIPPAQFFCTLGLGDLVTEQKVFETNNDGLGGLEAWLNSR